MAMLVISSASVGLARPQKDHKSWFKVIGQVIDGSGRPIQWGRVYIKDSRAHILKIKPVGRDGRFNIAWLDARLDYEIYAEQDDLISEKVLLSGSQSAAEVVITLKLRNK
jgi:hypothetical protein